jgi:hypothetical protein
MQETYADTRCTARGQIPDLSVYSGSIRVSGHPEHRMNVVLLFVILGAVLGYYLYSVRRYPRVPCRWGTRMIGRRSR